MQGNDAYWLEHMSPLNKEVKLNKKSPPVLSNLRSRNGVEQKKWNQTEMNEQNEKGRSWIEFRFEVARAIDFLICLFLRVCRYNCDITQANRLMLDCMRFIAQQSIRKTEIVTFLTLCAVQNYEYCEALLSSLVINGHFYLPAIVQFWCRIVHWKIVLWSAFRIASVFLLSLYLRCSGVCVCCDKFSISII